MILTDLETFIQVVENGSFTKAGKAMGVPTSTISRRVSRLEEELKLSLFHRNGRFFTITKVGQLVAKRCQPALRELSEVTKSLLDREGTPAGSISFTLSTELGGHQALAFLLRDFRKEYPEVVLSVEVTNRFVDLVEENVDVALRIHTKPLSDNQSLMMKRIVTMSAGLYASPDYLKKHKAPALPHELSEHDCVSGTQKETSNLWSLTHGKKKEQVTIKPVLFCNEFQLWRLALIAEMGIGPLPDFLVQKDIAENRLVRVLPEWTMISGHVSLVWPTTKYLAPRVRAFLDFMSLHFARQMRSTEKD